MLPSIRVKRDEKRQSEAKRQDNRRGQRAGPVNIADREPQRHVRACAGLFSRKPRSETKPRASTTKAASVAPI